MKRILFLLSAIALIFIFQSCEKGGVTMYEDVREAKLTASIHLEATTSTGTFEMGLPESQASTGENISLFVPFQIAQDDLEDAILQIRDHATGELIGEYALLPNTDPTIGSISIPEPLHGTNYLFTNLELTGVFSGKTIDISARLVAGKNFTEPALVNAFQIQ